MKASKMLISTMKEAPTEAKIDSHVLLLRAGLVKSLVAGVYTYLPLGLKVIKNIENIVRDEMDNSGSLEILASAIQPRELWDESGRWSKYGSELMRFTDRHEREFCLGPTHEEIFTSLAREQIKSPKNLPMNLYQIQTKYRDEMRPRYGLIRSREFIMKDAYSFDKDKAGLEKSYKLMYETYTRIFERLGLNFKIVLADTGAIGGDGSHQFMAISQIGESDIAYCDSCGYAADTEKAEAVPTVVSKEAEKSLEVIDTPDVRSIEEVSNFLEVSSNRLCKSIIYYDNESKKYILAMVRGDREINIIKLVNALNTTEESLVLADPKDFVNLGTINGFVGPVNIKNVEIFVDKEVAEERNIIVGANIKDQHLKNVNFGRDFSGAVLDLRQTVKQDKCPNCGSLLDIERGIEVGQLFSLGDKYSLSMNCTYQDELGKNEPMQMGCYGIGISRTLQAIVEQSHDDFGIVWPEVIAPYKVVIVPINNEIEEQAKLANELYLELKKKGIDVIYDDRKAKAGFKFKDWELIGIPYIITCGKLAGNRIVEFKNRATMEKVELNFEEVIEKF